MQLFTALFLFLALYLIWIDRHWRNPVLGVLELAVLLSVLLVLSRRRFQ